MAVTTLIKKKWLLHNIQKVPHKKNQKAENKI